MTKYSLKTAANRLRPQCDNCKWIGGFWRMIALAAFFAGIMVSGKFWEWQANEQLNDALEEAQQYYNTRCNDNNMADLWEKYLGDSQIKSNFSNLSDDAPYNKTDAYG